MSEDNIINLHDYLEQRLKEPITSFTAKKIRASLLKRFASFGLDIFIIGLIKVGFVNAYQGFLNSFFFQISPAKMQHIWDKFYVIDPLISISIFYGYFMFCFYSLNGKTIGKIWMKLSVIQDDFREGSMLNHSPDLRHAFLRATGYLMGYTSMGLLFLLPLVRSDKRGIQDILSQTVTLEDSQIYEHFITSQISHDDKFIHYEWDIKKAS